MTSGFDPTPTGEDVEGRPHAIALLAITGQTQTPGEHSDVDATRGDPRKIWMLTKGGDTKFTTNAGEPDYYLFDTDESQSLALLALPPVSQTPDGSEVKTTRGDPNNVPYVMITRGGRRKKTTGGRKTRRGYSKTTTRGAQTLL